MKILHFSDFHLNSEHEYDWNTYVKEALIGLIREICCSDMTDVFIVCTGDLIDKGGKEYGNIEDAFLKFKEVVIAPIIEELELKLDHFIMVPGNHDINRDLETKAHAFGLRSLFREDQNEIHKKSVAILDDNDREDVSRMIPFKKFEQSFYNGCSNINCSYLGTSFRYILRDGTSIGFAGFNTAWCAYDDTDKESGIVLGEEQYRRTYSLIKDCDIKVALMHHPLDWLIYEKNSVQSFIPNDFSILCSGHVHEGDSQISSRVNGTLFINVAPSLESDIRQGNGFSFANGLTFIDFDSTSGVILAQYFVYDFKQRKFILATSFAPEGRLSGTIKKKLSKDVDVLSSTSINYIRENFYSEIDEALIPQKASVKCTLKEIFVMPRVEQNGVYHSVVGLNELMQRRANYMLLGLSESGKTTLIHRILMEYVDNYSLYHLIPVYIDFSRIGNQDFVTPIKDFIDVSSVQAKSLLSAGRIVLLIDNLEPTDENKTKILKLKSFVDTYDVHVIATGTSTIGMLPEAFTSKLPIAFEFYFINNFGAEGVRDMITTWAPDRDSFANNDSLDELVNHFVSYSLPCTAMSVSLYLWTTNGALNKPMNRAVLLDMYIECALEKMRIDNVYRNSFNYGNKSSLIAYVAYKMDELQLFSIEFSTYLDILRQYLKDKGFDKQYDYRKLGEYFIEQKIFKCKDNVVSFAHSCFYHFFLAKYMLEDDLFRNQVLTPSRFYMYMEAIDYYTGLNRKDIMCVNFIFDQFEKFFEPAQIIYDEVDVDACFTYLVEGQKSYSPISESVDVKELVAKKNSRHEVEQKQNKVCNERINKISDELNNNSFVTPDKMIVLMGHVLRNSEELDVTMKRDIYSSFIKNVIIFLIAFKDSLAQYANKHNGELPPSYVNVRNVHAFFKYLPYNVQFILQELIGTRKLTSVFESKLRLDEKEKRADIEKYLSMALLWDNLGVEYEQQMKRFIRSLGRNSCQDYVLQKLYYIFNNKIKDDSPEEDIYLHLLADISVKQKRLSAIHRGFMYRELKEAREKAKVNALNDGVK